MTSLGKRDGPWTAASRRPPRYCVPQQRVKSKAGRVMGCPAISTAASDELSLSVCPVLRLLMVGESSSRCGSAGRETGSSTRCFSSPKLQSGPRLCWSTVCKKMRIGNRVCRFHKSHFTVPVIRGSTGPPGKTGFLPRSGMLRPGKIAGRALDLLGRNAVLPSRQSVFAGGGELLLSGRAFHDATMHWLGDRCVALGLVIDASAADRLRQRDRTFRQDSIQQRRSRLPAR